MSRTFREFEREPMVPASIRGSVALVLCFLVGDGYSCGYSRRAFVASGAAGLLLPAAPASAIIGGTAVTQAEQNLLGLVGLVVDNVGVCSGTRISDGLVLTARHCVCHHTIQRVVLLCRGPNETLARTRTYW